MAAPKTIGVKTIATDELQPNPHNPRMLFDRAPMEVLEHSIAKVGILVPLTVYFDSRRRKYVILDGQRRWTCARNLKLPEVPVNEVAEPTLVQNIVTIHKLRQDWELMPTALKLELLMKELEERNDKRLANLTGLEQAVVARCKKLLDYPKKYQDMMLDPDPNKRVKADFFIELYVVRNDRFVNSLEWYSRNRFTQAMLDRYRAGKLRSVTDFRLIKQHINNATKANRTNAISRRLREFTDDVDLPVAHLEVETASSVADARALTKTASRLIEDLRRVDAEACLGEEDFWLALEKLVRVIRRKLEAAGRRTGE